MLVLVGVVARGAAELMGSPWGRSSISTGRRRALSLGEGGRPAWHLVPLVCRLSFSLAWRLVGQRSSWGRRGAGHRSPPGADAPLGLGRGRSAGMAPGASRVSISFSLAWRLVGQRRSWGRRGAGHRSLPPTRPGLGRGRSVGMAFGASRVSISFSLAWWLVGQRRSWGSPWGRSSLSTGRRRALGLGEGGRRPRGETR